MAGFASLYEAGVVVGWADGQTLVVAGFATAEDLLVIDSRATPVAGFVAGVAAFAAGWMAGGFAQCQAVVMTAGATALHLLVIKTAELRPAFAVVAAAAVITAWQMQKGFAGSKNIVMTACTLSAWRCLANCFVAGFAQQ